MERNENNRGNCSECGDSRSEVIARAKEDLFKSTNIKSDEKEVAVIDNILFRCHQMGWLDRYEETKYSDLKPFNLEAAKAGKPVCTRDGRKARIICFDKKGTFPIIALVDRYDCKEELVYTYDNRGKCGMSYSIESSEDIMMLPEKHEGWVNVYNHGNNDTYVCNMIFATKELAENAVKHMNGVKHIATVKIEWEE